MAFVTVDNPSGILHHGGQMAWTTISNTRIALVTFTTDFKALIQEVNQVGGAPVLGTPYLIGQIPTPPAGAHLRPKIRNMGNDRIFVMVPNSWAVPMQTPVALQNNGWGSAASQGATTSERNNTPMPVLYTGYVMERNASGQYTVKSSVQFDSSYATSPFWSSSHYALTISVANDTQIVVRRAVSAPSSTSSYINSMTVTIPVANGILGTPVRALDQISYNSGWPSNMQVFEYKNVRDLQGNVVELIAPVTNSQPSYENSAIRTIWQLPITTNLKDPCYLVSGGSYTTGYCYRSAPILERLSLGGIAPVAGVQGDFYAVGGAAASNSAMYNANPISASDVLFCPLDTAFVTSDGVVCVAGGRNVAQTPYVTFDNDLAVHIYQSQLGTVVDSVWPLKLSFRLPQGLGQYVGPFDPIQTPYYYKDRMNNNRVIHRVDDTHFWLVGCFMANANAVPKLGVISVSV